MTDTVRKILDLSSLDRAFLSSDSASAASDTEGPLHPSLYLRMAMAAAPEAERGGLLGDTSHGDVGLLRLFGPLLMSQIKLLLNSTISSPSTSTQATAAPNTCPSLENDQVKRHIAAWTAVDHALSSELDVVASPDLGMADGGGDAHQQHLGAGLARPDPSNKAAAASSSIAARRDISSRAFSCVGDAREAAFLDAFAFKDQYPRADGVNAGQVDWTAAGSVAEVSHGGAAVTAVDGETGSGTSPEALAQERRDVEMARLEWPERFWNEVYEHLSR